MGKFLQILQPLGDHIGPLMFEFEYLNKNKMAGLGHFMEMFAGFLQSLPSGYQYCIEIRNTNFLKNEYFDFLAKYRLGPVFLQGYYMPPIVDLYEKYKDYLGDPVVLRLQGPDRQGMEKRTRNIWNKIVEPRDKELLQLRNMVNDLRQRRHQIFINVNNHYEGSAPRTIEKIRALLQLI
ncbi:DUF72 domain-containing protein [Desulfocastanea catecholica]